MNDNAKQSWIKNLIDNGLRLAPLDLFFPLLLVFYLVVAYNSVGYHQPDEHFQIIEFANYKMGLLPFNRLAWEYNSQIRSGLQPMICFIVFKGLKYFDITDGYILAFTLRALTALFSVFVIRYFVNVYECYIIKPLKIYFIIFSFLLWFLPYINVRFSSESWSGLFFLLALAEIEKGKVQNRQKSLFITGLFLGFALLFRYQSALFMLGIYFWFIFVGKFDFKKMAVCTSGLLISLFVGLFIDFWLYGKLTFSIYNYFYINIVQGVSNQFGTAPFYTYFIYILNAPGPLGILILASFFVLWYYSPKNLLLWAVTPFLIVHSFIPHKELRFLFPLANLCPLFLFLAYQNTLQSFVKLNVRQFYIKLTVRLILLLIVFIDVLGLYAIASTGAGSGKTSVTAFIHENFDEKKINIILNGKINPYIDYKQLKNTFYNSDSLHIDKIIDVWQNDFLLHKKANYRNLLIIYQRDITGPQELNYLKELGLIKIYQNIPKLTAIIYRFYNASLNNDQILVYEFR